MLFFISLMCGHLYAQLPTFSNAGADTVFSVRWGTGQNFGRMHFPTNVLGLPDTSARADKPSVDPIQICSIGLGGEIVLGWKNAVIVNQPGVDFIIFENAFVYLDNRIFVEPAKVAASRDGVQFVEFPFDSLTLKGCAGITPTNGNMSPFDARISGGDAFDLATIGMDSVRYIKITDISSLILDNPRHPFYDPTISGFDLDAVVGLSLVSRAADATTSVRSNPSIINTDMRQTPEQHRTFEKEFTLAEHNGFFTILRNIQNSENFTGYEHFRYELYSTHGAMLHSAELTGFSTIIPTRHYARGIYILVIKGGDYVWTRRILVQH